MHSLGVALLQIGRWRYLDPEDVVQIRKLVGQKSRLGPRYDDLTSKCLFCDFGFGADLDRPHLQAAIYENVICELEKMISPFGGPRAV